MAKQIVIEGAELTYLNFAGREGQYNAAGDRNFGVIVDDEMAEKLIDAGLTVKPYKYPDDEGNPLQFFKVKLNKDRVPYSVFVYTKKRKKLMEESQLAELDSADIINVDLTIVPRQYKTRFGKEGINAYLKIAHITIEEDPFYEKYAKYDDPRMMGDSNSDENEIPFE